MTNSLATIKLNTSKEQLILRQTLKTCITKVSISSLQNAPVRLEQMRGQAALLTTALALSSVTAFGGAVGLPWENGLTTIKNSMSGPVMLSIGVIVIVAIACAIAFAGEITEILKRFSSTTLSLGAGFGALGMVTALFGVAGAVI